MQRRKEAFLAKNGVDFGGVEKESIKGFTYGDYNSPSSCNKVKITTLLFSYTAREKKGTNMNFVGQKFAIMEEKDDFSS